MNECELLKGNGFLIRAMQRFEKSLTYNWVGACTRRRRLHKIAHYPMPDAYLEGEREEKMLELAL